MVGRAIYRANKIDRKIVQPGDKYEHDLFAGAPAAGQEHQITGRLVAPDKMKDGLTILDRAQHQTEDNRGSVYRT